MPIFSHFIAMHAHRIALNEDNRNQMSDVMGDDDVDPDLGGRNLIVCRVVASVPLGRHGANQ